LTEELRSATDDTLAELLGPFVDFLVSGLAPYVAPGAPDD